MSTAIELLLFEVRGVRFGVDATQVVRIERTAAAFTEAHAWGSGRTLIFLDEKGEARQFTIDHLSTVRTVSLQDLRRLPEPARVGTKGVVGVYIEEGDQVVLLLDLTTMAAT